VASDPNNFALIREYRADPGSRGVRASGTYRSVHCDTPRREYRAVKPLGLDTDAIVGEVATTKAKRRNLTTWTPVE
jgi:hypothetical protein